MKPAEMRALEELPGPTKDAMLPIIPLKSWVSARKLKSVTDRIEQSYGARPVAVSVGEREVGRDREVFQEIDRLRNPVQGFSNWVDFLRNHPNYIPVAQIGSDPLNELEQIRQLSQLGRGLVVPVERQAIPSLPVLAQGVARATDGGRGVCFLIDFGTASKDHLSIGLQVLGYFQTIIAAAPLSHVSISASSFPSNFSNIPRQREIYERLLFREVVRHVPEGRLIYSDRGSARAEPLSGGSGVIPARIDYPQFDNWWFFRDDDAGASAYGAQARALMANAVWNPDLRVWGTQMIERTARGDHSAIDNPTKATAARINLHLQLQTFYGEPGLANDTEEDWDG
ncbi:hypothetical protein FHW96_002848 [Novosphingobium sp. SG751A]|nr:hypothetical protein [Novosphingobium sp. SG751A]